MKNALRGVFCLEGEPNEDLYSANFDVKAKQRIRDPRS